MYKIEHYSSTMYQIKDVIYEFLYDPVRKQFKQRIDALILRNTLKGGYSHRHFTYRGSIYNSDVTPPPINKNHLHPSMQQQMDDYLADLNDINKQKLPAVLGFINQILNLTGDLNDYVRISPESTHYPLIRLASSCPWRTQHLDERRVQSLISENKKQIGMIRRRLASNLLIRMKPADR